MSGPARHRPDDEARPRDGLLHRTPAVRRRRSRGRGDRRSPRRSAEPGSRHDAGHRLMIAPPLRRVIGAAGARRSARDGWSSDCARPRGSRPGTCGYAPGRTSRDRWVAASAALGQRGAWVAGRRPAEPDKSRRAGAICPCRAGNRAFIDKSRHGPEIPPVLPHPGRASAPAVRSGQSGRGGPVGAVWSGRFQGAGFPRPARPRGAGHSLRSSSRCSRPRR